MMTANKSRRIDNDIFPQSIYLLNHHFSLCSLEESRSPFCPCLIVYKVCPGDEESCQSAAITALTHRQIRASRGWRKAVLSPRQIILFILLDRFV